MCDEVTEAENSTYLESLRLSRRDAGLGAGATLAAMLTGCAAPAPAARAPNPTAAPATPPASAPTAMPPPEPPAAEPPTEPPASAATNGRMLTISMPDGEAEAFYVTPKSGKHPGVLMWPDVAGLRDAYKTMATRLAGEGYAVLVVNQYYRSAKLPIVTSFAEWRTEAGKKKIGPLKEALTPERVASDGAAFVAWLDQQPEVDPNKKAATTGYCMGGPYTLRTAAAAPQRVGVVASFHGGGLVTNDATSPHLLFPKMKAATLICIARSDDERDPAAKTVLRRAAEQASIPAEIEVYPAQHGWCVLDTPVYDRTQADLAWSRMLSTFERYV